MTKTNADPESAPLRVAVVGGGLAGIAASLALARAGATVTLFERRPFLGGRAYSFRDPDSGAVIDNGQHVLVGACSRLRALLSAIDSPPNAFVRQSRLEVPVLDARGRAAAIRGSRLPAPFHALAALAGYRHLRPLEAWAVARAVRALATTHGRSREALEPVPLGEWLATREMPARAVERFWEPVVRPALNVPVADANVPLTAFFLERVLWADRAGGALWLPAVGLSEAIGEPAAGALARAGVRVCTGLRVRTLLADVDRVVGVALGDGTRLLAESVVVALPPRALDDILSEANGRFIRYNAIGSSPIVNVYLWYDRPVARFPFAGAFGTCLQWVFDRACLLGDDRSSGECLGVSLSAADDVLDWTKEALADRCDEAIAKIFPARRHARRIRHAVVKEPHATFRAGPAVAGLRPGPHGPLRGLYLAGDWTATGWPATMEGAVLSGEAAARAALTGVGRRVPVPVQP